MEGTRASLLSPEQERAQLLLLSVKQQLLRAQLL